MHLVLVPNTLRTVIVVSDSGEVAVALREALPREMTLVLDARPDELGSAFTACRPYPWVVVWNGASPPPPLLEPGRHPVLVLARGSAWTRFRELVARLQAMLTVEVGGMRLAPGLGVALDDGRLVDSAALQALLCAHPHGVSLDAPAARRVSRVLAAAGGTWEVERAASGRACLTRRRVMVPA